MALREKAKFIKQRQTKIESSTADKTGETMKWTAVFLNALLLLALSYLLATKGAPQDDELFLVIVLFAAPLASLFALIRSGEDGWLGLYFKRKALEERQRIKNLGGQ